MGTLTEIFSNGHNRHYPKGQILLYQGEETSDVIHVNEGYVKVYDVTAKGAQKIFVILGPGDIFPLIWTFKGADRLHYFYETMTDADICVITRADFEAEIEKSHDLTRNLLEYFVNRSKELMGRIESIEATNAKHVVAHVLHYLAQTHGEPVAKNTYKVTLPITHQIIADMAGITRETASIQLKQLHNDKMYTSENDILLIHDDRLEKFFDEM